MSLQPNKCMMVFVCLLAGAIGLEAQTTIVGHVCNSSKEGLAEASVRVRESGKGVNADSTGHFSLMLNGGGKRNLVISAVGYVPKVIGVLLADSMTPLEIELKDSAASLGEAVVISAGSFEASDKAKGASLTPMDAVTVAGNGGDIANALRFLPGAQQIGEREGLFVRGGSSEETKQFMDGGLVPYPNFAGVPGLPQPARLNPFLFKGILFSSGGYSALYGDALSSALILESVDLPEKSSATFSLFPQNISGGFQDLAKAGNSSYGATARYGNMRFYNSVVPQIPDFYRGPAYFSQDANFRIRTSPTGMLKFYAELSYSNVALRYPDIDSSSLLSSFAQQNTNVYSNLSYRESLGNNWKVDAAAAYNFYENDLASQLLASDKTPLFLSAYPYNDDNNSINTRTDFAEARAVLRKQYAHNQALRFGAEYVFDDDR
ncbi:MAG TPA: TonB-dependent receptor, partial [Puia sp.]|nr:TonB-dependent receptor [Puia sp.]